METHEKIQVLDIIYKYLVCTGDCTIENINHHYKNAMELIGVPSDEK